MLSLIDLFKLKKSKNFFKDFSIVFFVVFFIVILLWGVIYKLQISEAKKEILTVNNAEAEQCIKDIEESINQIKRLSVYMAMDNTINIYVMNNVVYSTDELSQKFLNTEKFYKGIVRDITKICIYSDLAGTVYEDGIINKVDSNNRWWIDSCKKNDSIGLQLIKNKNKQGEEYCFATKLNVNNYSGILGIKVNFHRICNEITKGMNYSSNFYWVDENNEVIFDAQQSKYKRNKNFDGIKEIINSQGTIDETKFIVYESELGVEGWRYYYLTERARYSDKFRLINTLMLIFSVVLFFISVSMAYVFIINKVKPLLQLTDLLENCGDTEIMDDVYDEYVKNISSKIILLLNTNRELQKKIDTNVIERHKLQMNVLVSQINPHFVNNTLNVLGFISMDKNGKNDEVTKGITKLSRVIRHGYKNDVMFINIREEVSFLKEYIELLNLRYTNSQIILDVDDSVLDEKILKLTVQPLLENAVSYGISTVHKNGVVRIRIRNNNETIMIEVEDNGTGIKPEMLEQIRVNMDDEEVSSEHIGIVNVYKRLKMAYGNKMEFKLESEKGAGTKISIKIPKVY